MALSIKIKGTYISTEDIYKLTEQKSQLFRRHSKYEMLNVLFVFFLLRILQYCYKAKLSLTHNCYLCCWKMVCS